MLDLSSSSARPDGSVVCRLSPEARRLVLALNFRDVGARSLFRPSSAPPHRTSIIRKTPQNFKCRSLSGPRSLRELLGTTRAPLCSRDLRGGRAVTHWHNGTLHDVLPPPPPPKSMSIRHPTRAALAVLVTSPPQLQVPHIVSHARTPQRDTDARAQLKALSARVGDPTQHKNQNFPSSRFHGGTTVHAPLPALEAKPPSTQAQR